MVLLEFVAIAKLHVLAGKVEALIVDQYPLPLPENLFETLERRCRENV